MKDASCQEVAKFVNKWDFPTSLIDELIVADHRFCSRTTFYCQFDDMCIPSDRRCDMVYDCPSRSDEDGCNTSMGFCHPAFRGAVYCYARMGSCLEVWESGFRQSGTYPILSEEAWNRNFQAYEAVCRFQPTDTGLMVFTDLFWFDIVDLYYTRDLFQEPYPDMYILSDWNLYTEYLNTNNCTQIIQQSCDPNMAIIDEIDGLAGHDHDENYRHVDYTRCLCLRLLINNRNFGNRTSVESCLPYLSFFETDINLEERLLFSINASFPVGLLSKTIDGPLENYIRVIPGPLVCHREFDTSDITEQIVCGTGVYAPVSTRCLYDHDGYGNVVGCRNLAHLIDCETFECPEGYVKCPDSFCVAWRFLCDGDNHCPNGEDELDCDQADPACRNGYRCRGTKICIPTALVCDGQTHCKHHDDERLCNFKCPELCDCVGLTVDCSDGRFEDLTWYNVSATTRILTLRQNQHVFDSYSGQREVDLPFLLQLDISHCTLGTIPAGIFDTMVNLEKLTIRHTDITVLDAGLFLHQTKLTELDLSGSIHLSSIKPNAFRGLVNVRSITITGTRIHTLLADTFSGLVAEKLDISNNLIETVQDFAFKDSQVDSVHIENNPILSYSDSLFSGMVHVQDIDMYIYTDAYAFCCIRPVFVTEENCFPHRDVFSSCEDLIRKEVLRAFLWIVSLTSILGNVLSLVYRLVWDTSRLKLGYGIFVTNLAISDFMMGVYLLIIAIVDVVFRGSYMTEDIWWRNSHGCTFAGMLATISSEASILFMCLITVDRLLVIKYPFGQLKFTTRSASVASALCWILCIAIAMFPIWHSSYFKGQFYNKASVCLALPLTQDRSPGWAYSITIFIGFNFVTFCLISFGQWLIYSEIRKSKAGIRKSKNRAADLRVTRNLLLVVTTDFLCWFPIGVMGIMGWGGTVIPPDIYAWTAIFILPINAAINPILYTFLSIIRDKSFAPRRDEQAAVIHADSANTVLSFWSSSRFVGPFAHNLLPLPVALRRQPLTAVSILRPALVLTRCIDRMHTNGFVAGNLTMDDLFCVKSQKQVLKVKPMVATRDSQKADDIKSVGQIILNLLRMYGQRDGDKV